MEEHITCRCGCGQLIERHSYETDRQFAKRHKSGLFRAKCAKNLPAKPERGNPTLELISCNNEPLEGVEQPKDKPEHDPKYQAWIRDMPCLVPGCLNESQFHHQNEKGHGAKGGLCSDYRGLPLCCWHHTLGGTPGKPGSYHGSARITGWRFWSVYGVDVEAAIHRLNTLWIETGHKFKKG
jgi:hypothetical protein